MKKQDSFRRAGTGRQSGKRTDRQGGKRTGRRRAALLLFLLLCFPLPATACALSPGGTMSPAGAAGPEEQADPADPGASAASEDPAAQAGGAAPPESAGQTGPAEPETPAISAVPAAPVTEYELTVFFLDETGAPVRGAVATLCSDTVCRTLTPDAEGKDTVTLNTAQQCVLTVPLIPEGYVLTGEQERIPSPEEPELRLLFRKETEESSDFEAVHKESSDFSQKLSPA